MRREKVFKSVGFYAVVAFLLSIVVYSCKKEFNSDTVNNASPVVLAAKSWYQNNYPAKNISSVKTNTTTESPALSNLLQPYWDAAREYTRGGVEVVETPITDSVRIALGLKNEAGGRPYKKEQSKTSFLILKKADGYHAYIMTILADSSYLNGDYTKLQKNTYQKRDDNFSGQVVYYTPEGKYAGSYRYKNGQQVVNSTQSGKNTNAVKVNTEQCIDWYWCVWTADGVLISETYVFTTCSNDNSLSGDSQNKTCTINNAYGGANKQVNTFQDEPPACPTSDCDGGLGPPQDDCLNEALLLDIENDVQNPCLNSMVTKTLNQNLRGSIISLINSVFNGSDQPKLKFIDGSLSGVAAITTSTITTDGVLLRATVTLNSDVLPNSSAEYIAATVLHEVLHAYMNSKNGGNTQLDHEDMAINYVSKMAAELKSMFPNLSLADATALSYGGLESTSTYNFNVSHFPNLATNYAVANNNYLNGKSGTPCP